MVKKMNVGKKVLFTLFALLMCSLPCLCIEETTENLEPIELNKPEESLKEKIETVMKKIDCSDYQLYQTIDEFVAEMGE